MKKLHLFRKDTAQSDEQLVDLARSGDKEAFRVLVERHQGRLLMMASDILKSREEAEDVVQESFVKAYLALDSFKGESNWYTWLYRIAYNMAIDIRRRGERRGGSHVEYREEPDVKGSGGDSLSSAGGGAEEVERIQSIEGPHAALMRKETGSKLHAELARLSPEHRTVIMLREVDGLTYDEIAAAVGAPRGTVMSRLYYARKALQEGLRNFVSPDDEVESGQRQVLDEELTSEENGNSHQVGVELRVLSSR